MKKESLEETLNRLSSSDLGNNVHILYDKTKKINNGILIDLGVRTGVSSETLLINADEKNNKVFGVDVDFSQTAGHVKSNPNYNLIPGDSVTVGKNWDQKIDFLFVDTFHIKEQVMCELFYWYPCLKIGATIAFHDSNWPEGKHDVYGGIVWDRVEKGIMEFFGINTLTYEDEFIKVENYPDSWGMTFVTIKKHKDYLTTENWKEIFNRRNKLIGMFWNPDNIGNLELELVL